MSCIFVMPEDKVMCLCRALSLVLQRGLLYRHDFRVLYALSFSATKISVVYRSSRDKKINPSTLIAFHVAGHNLPYILNLNWLFLSYKIVCVLEYSEHTFSCLTKQRISRMSTDSQKFGYTSTSFSDTKVPFKSSHQEIGGGRSFVFPFASVAPYLPKNNNFDSASVFHYVDHIDLYVSDNVSGPTGETVLVNFPLHKLVPHLSVSAVRKIARLHHISIGSHVPKAELSSYFIDHSCVNCESYISRFSIGVGHVLKDKLHRDVKKVSRSAEQVEQERQKKHQRNQEAYATKKTSKLQHNLESSVFPPKPLSHDIEHLVISGFCDESMPEKFEEAGCAVCGLLNPLKNLTRLKSVKGFLHILESPGTTRVERKSSNEKIREYKGPVLDYNCDKICDNCRRSVRNSVVPKLALANGLWLGNIPKELAELRFVEKLLVARIRHNCCFIKVASGLRKMTSHIIAFETPIKAVYNELPPPIETLDEVLAVLFTGPCKPTEEDLKRTPVLVRRNHIARALEWLKLNHPDYKDLRISSDNLAKYPEDGVPVSIEYRHALTNKVPEGTSVFDDELEDGTETGNCPFTVHGLYGEELDTKYKTAEVLKGIAVQHWEAGGKALRVGHSKFPESIYKNPALYPSIFPWLFPYGLGGVGSTSLSDAAHKKYLLMYHDKRFQTDVNFPLVAFSHAQIKAGTTGGFLLAKTNKFHDISNRLLQVDQLVLSALAKRMAEGELVKPDTQEEKDCFQLIRDIDYVGGKVDGSTTKKKYMRNEIWSLISYQGAPSWYITLSPADINHPICLYFADTEERFSPTIKHKDIRRKLVGENPVAGARFFHFMVTLFIKHVLGVDADHPGIYGNISAYYGTVEQQGRLMLHLHMLLWIRGCLSPQEIRRCIMDPTLDFQRRLVEYLESTHVGEFFTGSQEAVLSSVEKASCTEGYLDPTLTLPEAPPQSCHANCGTCDKCQILIAWWCKFETVFDDILSKSNIHRCSTNRNKDGTRNKNRDYTGCIDNKYGNCKARFPRKLYEHTEVDPETGAINMKKREAMINTVTPVITYLFRSNTDITSLKSGTAIKAVILYVTDYITKMSLKTHVIFDTVRALFQKNSDMLGGNDSRKEKARQLVTKIVNSLSAKMEIGSPMACMYILGNPDHYTNKKFALFYWQSYLQEVRQAWHEDETNDQPGKIALLKREGQIVGLSPVHDYIYRPVELSSMTLYEWVGRCKHEKLPKEDGEECVSDNEDNVAAVNDKSEVKLEYTDTDSDISKTSDCLDFDLETSSKLQKMTLEDVTEQKTPEKGLFTFLDQHPLYQTHGTRCKPEAQALIPNFVGATLPRCDQGDREYYCSAMMMLFKPWRSGRDLKTNEQSWDDVFTSYNFTHRQYELMANFNIKYECLDSRDDFHAQF